MQNTSMSVIAIRHIKYIRKLVNAGPVSKPYSTKECIAKNFLIAATELRIRPGKR